MSHITCRNKRGRCVSDGTSPYDVLDITYTATEADVKRLFRKKSLLIHPDKFKHENAEEVSIFFTCDLIGHPC